MQISKSTTEFLTLLKKSELLPQADLQDAALTAAQLDDPTQEAIADVLVEDGYLTRFQADRLLEGSFRGLVIDGYKIVEVLGRGGMGWVYIAEDSETHWRVAIKVLPDEARHDAGTLARFRLEAQAGMRLNHPNIVRSHKLGEAEDRYGRVAYMVMELVRGVNLFEFMLMKKKLDVGHACDIIMQAAQGLEYAHEQGLVHRDIKPENILICADGTVKILDFGLAMIDENDEEFSMAMIFGQNRLGTADYISPEQYLDSYQVDARADLYSLGCTLYFALTGKVPFPFESSGQKLKAHLKKKATPVQKLRPDVPRQVAAIVAKLMAKRPENRFQTAKEVARYLRPLAERQATAFNFRSVLNARMSHAKRKEQHKEAKIRDQGSTARSLSDAVKPAPDETRQSTIETIVREETLLNQKELRKKQE
ncbi:MAG: serine/threonine-protein kinase [Planctomycetota bacterium]|nr:serine/threonine-protein kinase [Planctomycetota bacterium]